MIIPPMNAPQQYPLPVPPRPSTIAVDVAVAVDVDVAVDATTGESAAATKANITKDQLKDYLRQNEIDCIDLANGRIVYSKTKVRAPLNNGQLKTALTTYYKDDADKATNLTQFLLAARVERTRESIKMKIPKNK